MGNPMTITKEDVELAWSKFMKYTETAEQHEFIMLAIIQYRLESAYEDLMRNWDEHHALIFMENMTVVHQKLGIK